MLDVSPLLVPRISLLRLLVLHARAMVATLHRRGTRKHYVGILSRSPLER